MMLFNKNVFQMIVLSLIIKNLEEASKESAKDLGEFSKTKELEYQVS